MLTLLNAAIVLATILAMGVVYGIVCAAEWIWKRITKQYLLEERWN